MTDVLIATRHIDASVERVWAAFTTPSSLAAFWGGYHAVVPLASVTVDLRVGGWFELDCGRRLRFRYDAIEPPTRLVLFEPTTGITTEIRLEGATTVTVHQTRVPVELQTEQAAEGLAGILEKLEEVVT
jgi:uncharacterized protein YndB with AHSA1/START domain